MLVSFQSGADHGSGGMRWHSCTLIAWATLVDKGICHSLSYVPCLMTIGAVWVFFCLLGLCSLRSFSNLISLTKNNRIHSLKLKWNMKSWSTTLCLNELLRHPPQFSLLHLSMAPPLSLLACLDKTDKMQVNGKSKQHNSLRFIAGEVT